MKQPKFKKGDRVVLICDRRRKFTLPEDLIIEKCGDLFLYRLADSTVGIMEFEMEAVNEGSN